MNLYCTKILSFPLRISSVNVTKYVGNCRLDHIYWRNPQWKTSFCYAFGCILVCCVRENFCCEGYGKILMKTCLLGKCKNRVKAVGYFSQKLNHSAQKKKFALRISSVNVTKSAVSCGFGSFFVHWHRY